MENQNQKVRVDEDLLLKLFWDEENIKGVIDLHKDDTFKCKVYSVCFEMLQKKLNELNEGNDKRKFFEFSIYFQHISQLRYLNRILLDNLKKGKIYYEENDGYPTDEIDESKTLCKIMESVLTKEEIQGLKSDDEVNFNSELHKILKVNRINKN